MQPGTGGLGDREESALQFHPVKSMELCVRYIDSDTPAHRMFSKIETGQGRSKAHLSLPIDMPVSNDMSNTILPFHDMK